MKNKKWIFPVLILLCLVIFIGYRLVERMGEDTKPPEIKIDGELSISVSDPQSTLLNGVTAHDNRDGDVTYSLVVESIEYAGSGGNMNVTYAAFDSAGNVKKAERMVTYTDYHSPRFELSAPLAFSSNNFDVFSIVGAEDVFDGNIRHRVRASVAEDTSISGNGIYDVQFRVTNSVGDSVVMVLPLEVYSSEAYNASLVLTDYLVYIPVGSEFNKEDYLDKFVCYGDEIDISTGSGNRYFLRAEGKVDTQTPGVYAITYEVTYNQNYKGYSRLLVVVEG